MFQWLNQRLISKLAGVSLEMASIYRYLKFSLSIQEELQERGTQGFAITSFTITESGTVEDAVALEGYCGDPEDPNVEMRECSIFNSASVRASLKLKYKPKIVDGKPTPVEGS